LVFRLKTHHIVSHAHSLCTASPGVGFGIAPAEFPEGHRGEIVRVGALDRRTKLGEVARGTTTVTLNATGGVSVPKVEQVEDDIVKAPPSLSHRSSGRHVGLHHLPASKHQPQILSERWLLRDLVLSFLEHLRFVSAIGKRIELAFYNLLDDDVGDKWHAWGEVDAAMGTVEILG
jgi:hypothetical protein